MSIIEKKGGKGVRSKPLFQTLTPIMNLEPKNLNYCLKPIF